MMTSEVNNMEYYQSRVLKERELARTARDVAVARIHLEMAEHYEQMIKAASMTSEANSRGSLSR